MDARRESEPTPIKNRTTVERKSEREIVVTRIFNAPARIVFEVWLMCCSSFYLEYQARELYQK